VKHIVRKLYWNFEKEEQWLNDMAANGLSLTGYSRRRYEFEDTEKSEYTYRLELLDQPASHPKSQEYIAFVSDTKAQLVASNKRWVYFRKKTSEGVFDLYSDINSKLRHYKKVRVLLNTIALVNLCAGLICTRFLFPQQGVTFTIVDLAFGIVGVCLLVFSGVLLLIGTPVRKRIRQLKKESEIREA